MSARIISGVDVANEIRKEIKRDVENLKSRFNITPGLVTIIVGNNPASVSYVTAKQKTAKDLGFYSIQENLPEKVSKIELLSLIEKYNKDEKIHGILVQLPLPHHINEKEIIYTIDPNKDVDGFHPVNMGRLVIGEALFYPCTPYGIQQLLIKNNIETEGAEVVVLGRSNIVGKPIAMMLCQKAKGANATVTICHTGTKNLTVHTKRADILIVALGSPKAITADMVKEGAVVIDVGVNRIGTTPEGKARLCGDVDFESVKEKVSAITPVPGGVGPMTITMLMLNTLNAAKKSVEG
ncbi:MAG TPA: bifunctional methylenetetrahydrofolate dehydrogenase/methenyltetrahydrofolate cyclohydrolase FolD [Syntrophorhabdaceae bacterium]|nr:bifunctional methylenetetrahydrofolate dehydrogenase/methenyltetrahydrofolate cyclohydrolase FolD [Syntrophorhabdaceae bacterium]HPU30001.1 bifunctional methylenetetrahydrofolate dehydrogenase/methenyltetrahydrofolate cyclohydrolase FolD [Syntrophorhabdaceae bacterium]